jgi:hypothetical protein
MLFFNSNCCADCRAKHLKKGLEPGIQGHFNVGAEARTSSRRGFSNSARTSYGMLLP